MVENVAIGASAGRCLDRLPELHHRLLEGLNGFTVQAGTLRVFGVGRGDALDLGWWNEPRTWRFAWDDRVDPYVCFAATAWGDQYAYRRGTEPVKWLLPEIF